MFLFCNKPNSTNVNVSATLVNIEAEKTFLCNVLNSPSLLNNADYLKLNLNKDDFAGEKAGLFFEEMNNFAESTGVEQLNTTTFQMFITEKHPAKLFSNNSFLSSILICRIFPESAVIEIAKSIKKLSLRRNLIQSSESLRHDAIELNGRNLDEVIQQTEDRLEAIKTSNSETPLESGGVIELVDSLRRLQEVEAPRLIPTGFKKLDDYIAFVPGTLNTLAARPGVGKTAFALNIADYNMAKPENKGEVLFISLELSMDEVFYRLISSVGQIDYRLIQRRDLSSVSSSNWAKAIQRIKSYERKPENDSDSSENYSLLNVITPKKAITTPNDIRRYVRNSISTTGHPPSLVIIDYVQLMRMTSEPNDFENLPKIYNDVCYALKNIAREYDVPILILSQVGLSVDRRNTTPTAQNIAGSTGIHRASDVMLILHKESNDSNQVQVIVEKNRSGPAGATLILGYVGQYYQFVDNY